MKGLEEAIKKLNEDVTEENLMRSIDVVVEEFARFKKDVVCIKLTDAKKLKQHSFVNRNIVEIADGKHYGGEIIPHQRLILFKEVEKLLGDAPQ